MARSSSVGGTGSPHANAFCDSIERFNYAPTSSNEKPAWHMYTDGDTIHSVVVTSQRSTTPAPALHRHQGPISPIQAIPAGATVRSTHARDGTSGSSAAARFSTTATTARTKTATYRPGIGALNPTTGTVLSWDPQRSRNEGAKSLYVTSAGLWVGSDGADAGCTNPGGANHDDCNGRSPLDVGGDAFFPVATP